MALVNFSNSDFEILCKFNCKYSNLLLCANLVIVDDDDDIASMNSSPKYIGCSENCSCQRHNDLPHDGDDDDDDDEDGNDNHFATIDIV